jgi:hypothetical protein
MAWWSEYPDKHVGHEVLHPSDYPVVTRRFTNSHQLFLGNSSRHRLLILARSIMAQLKQAIAQESMEWL